MFRPQIKVLDCTIRDGGLINDYNFTEDFVKAVYRAICDSGVDYIEIGKKLARSADFPEEKFGPWNFCDDDLVKKIVDSYDCPVKPKIAVMFDVGRIDVAGMIPVEKAPYQMIRTACYVKDIDKGIDLCKRSKDLGYETTINIMAVSNAIESDLEEALAQVAATKEIDTLYLVDSFGAFYQEQITTLMKMYQKFCPNKVIGIHTHNNQQMGFSNTIQAIIDNANMIDATINGIGRGAGNCPLELLLFFLKNPKFDVKPIYKVIQQEFVPLRAKMEWGFNDIYGISGMLDQHPRDAMKTRDDPAIKDLCYDFYLKSAGLDLDIQ